PWTRRTSTQRCAAAARARRAPRCASRDEPAAAVGAPAPPATGPPHRRGRVVRRRHARLRRHRARGLDLARAARGGGADGWPPRRAPARRAIERGGDRRVSRRRGARRTARWVGALRRTPRSPAPALLALSRRGPRGGRRPPARGPGDARATDAGVMDPTAVTPLDPGAYAILAESGFGPDLVNQAQHRACELVERYTLEVAIDLVAGLGLADRLARAHTLDE